MSNSEIIEMTQEETKIMSDKESEAKVEEKPKREAPFKAALTDEAVLQITCDLKAAIASEDYRMILKTFLLEQADSAMMFVFSQREKMAEQKAKIIQVGNKQGMRKFVSGLFK